MEDLTVIQELEMDLDVLNTEINLLIVSDAYIENIKNFSSLLIKAKNICEEILKISNNKSDYYKDIVKQCNYILTQIKMGESNIKLTPNIDKNKIIHYANYCDNVGYYKDATYLDLLLFDGEKIGTINK